MPSKRKFLTGFTLIEIIVSAVIMATTIAGIFTVFTSGNKFVQRSNRRLIAINLAQEQLENRRVRVAANEWGDAVLFPPNADPEQNGLRLTATLPTGWTNWANIPIASPILFDYRYRVDADNHNAIPSNVPATEACRRVYLQVRFPKI
ncbi:MAG: type II secretion system protein [Candidatus Omnitrophota bacterium]